MTIFIWPKHEIFLKCLTNKLFCTNDDNIAYFGIPLVLDQICLNSASGALHIIFFSKFELEFNVSRHFFSYSNYKSSKSKFDMVDLIYPV